MAKRTSVEKAIKALRQVEVLQGRGSTVLLCAVATGHRDCYDRLLAYVTLPDGTDLGAEIIRLGYGHAYTRFPFARMDEFRALEREAREAGRGLWAGEPEKPPAAATP